MATAAVRAVSRDGLGLGKGGHSCWGGQSGWTGVRQKWPQLLGRSVGMDAGDSRWVKVATAVGAVRMDWGQPLGKSGHGCWGGQDGLGTAVRLLGRSGWTLGTWLGKQVATAVGPVSRDGLGGQRLVTTGQAPGIH